MCVCVCASMGAFYVAVVVVDGRGGRVCVYMTMTYTILHCFWCAVRYRKNVCVRVLDLSIYRACLRWYIVHTHTHQTSNGKYAICCVVCTHAYSRTCWMMDALCARPCVHSARDIYVCVSIRQNKQFRTLPSVVRA